jgi:hypothetical protein
MFQLSTQSLSIRGEVQSPKTIIHPMHVNIGEVYVNAPIKFSVTIQNLTNLGSKFKLERPGGDSSAFRLTYDEKSGQLGPLESKTITVTFTALISGSIDEIIGCKVFGTPAPIGFTFAGKVKGVQVDIVTLGENEIPPVPLGAPTETQYSGSGSIPAPMPIQPLEFGNDVVLYDRKVRKFAIRNLSAIGFIFEIRPRRYDLGFMNPTSENVSAKGTKYALEPHESGENVYNSEAGKKHIMALLKRQEDKAYLTLGLGASYQIEPKCGEVVPWGVTVITVTSRNDMPGCFDDDIICDIKEFRKLSIPVKMNVLGCPLVIERDSYGMSSNGSDLCLHMGNASVNSEPLTREFRVRNNGSSAAYLEWKVRNVTSKVNGPVKLELKLGTYKDKTRVSTKIQFWDDVAKETPYVVEPAIASIPAYSKRNFKVRLLRTSNIGMELASLGGTISFEEADDASQDADSASHLSESHSRTSFRSSNTKASSKSAYRLKLDVKAVLMEPQLKVNKTLISTSSSGDGVVYASESIKLKTNAPALFSKSSSDLDACSKIVALTNPAAAVLAISVSVEGPFTAKLSTEERSDAAIADKKTNAKQIETSKLMSTSVPANIASNSSIGSTCVLLAQVFYYYYCMYIYLSRVLNNLAVMFIRSLSDLL